jgi:pilus assembly protein CpaB
MNRKLVSLLAALALALTGTFLLVGYVSNAEAKATEGEDLVPVLVVKEKIDAGTASESLAGKVVTEQVPAKVRSEGAVTDLAALKGKVAAVDLLPGEQVVSERFVAPTAVGKATAPPDLLEVTVSLEPHRALGGQLVPGPTVAVMITVDDIGNGDSATHLVLHKIKVTSVQTSETEEAADDSEEATRSVAPSGNLLVTLAVDAPAAERVVWAAEKGHLWLAAEPLTANEGGTSVQTKGSVLR